MAISLSKSKIDTLVEKRDKLKIKRQSIKDKTNEKNSNIQTKLKKLENKAWINRKKADKAIEDIDRTLAKISRDIDSEKAYINSIDGHNSVIDDLVSIGCAAGDVPLFSDSKADKDVANGKKSTK